MENNDVLPPAPLFSWENLMDDLYHQVETFGGDDVNSLPQEVIDEINFLNGSDDFNTDFIKYILGSHKNRAEIIVNNFKCFCLIIMYELKKTIKKKGDLFTYVCPRVRGGNTVEEAIQIYRKCHSEYSLVCDFIIEQLSKQERFKNPRLIALKEVIGWRIYLTCDIVYDIKYP